MDGTIPRELDRICLKALSKRSSDRFSTALDLAEDLRCWLATQRQPLSPDLGRTGSPTADQAVSGDQGRGQPRVVPKGLRSFDDEDSNFFLGLLPGPRDRDGLPSTIRFWKTRIEASGPDRTFRAGLLYGPSGCGKSSFVKAGLLPRLAPSVCPVYLEASASDTEARLRRSLQHHWPELPRDLGLAAALTRLRQDASLLGGHKLLIVIDQFEQWLHGRPIQQDLELVQALRQCDGRRVQCLILVRDDFWMSVTRFLRELEVPLAEGENSASVDLFDVRHARHVLREFGRAYGALPEHDLTPEQERFLERAVAELAQDERVIPVRLTLFGEMVKNKAWNPLTLTDVGGAEGIGVAFLEEMLGTHAASPGHRLHQKAARAVLKALLPEQGREIKGQMQSCEQLLAASGYAASPGEFAEVLHILDNELRLVTPVDLAAGQPANPEGLPAAGQGGLSQCYQLSHDFLIRPIRQWLSAKQLATRSGRAELRLEERAALWSAKPEKRQLPSFWEWAQILLLARGTPWTGSQAQMMAVATRFHARRAALVAGLLAVSLAAGAWYQERLEEHRRAARAESLVSQLLVAEIDRVPEIIAALDGYHAWAGPRLSAIVNDPGRPAKQRLQASLALLASDPGQLPYLRSRLLTASPDELLVIRLQLEPWKESLTESLWQTLEDNATGADQKLRAASALAAFDPTSRRWQPVASQIVGQLVKENSLLLQRWIQALRPVSDSLIEPLTALYRGPDATTRDVATVILADYAATRPELLAELIKDADSREYKSLIGLLDLDRPGSRGGDEGRAGPEPSGGGVRGGEGAAGKAAGQRRRHPLSAGGLPLRVATPEAFPGPPAANLPHSRARMRWTPTRCLWRSGGGLSKTSPAAGHCCSPSGSVAPVVCLTRWCGN